MRLLPGNDPVRQVSSRTGDWTDLTSWMTLDPDFLSSFDPHNAPIMDHDFHRSVADRADGIEHCRRDVPIDGMAGLPFSRLHVGNPYEMNSLLGR